MLALDEQGGKGKAKAREAFRLRDHVRHDPGFFKAKVGAGAPDPGLDVVHDQQRAQLFRQLCDALHPFIRSGVQTAFALHRLKDKGRRRIDTRGGVFQHGFDELQCVHALAHCAVVGQVGDVAQMAAARAVALAHVTGQRQRTHGHAMEAIGKGDDVAASGDLARQLHRGLDRVGAGRSGQHDLVVQATRFEDIRLESLKERGLGVGVHVQPVRNPIAADMVDQRGLHVGIVVPVVE